MKKNELKELEKQIEDMKCCANCSQYQCPHRDIFSKTPCTEEDDIWKWEI